MQKHSRIFSKVAISVLAAGALGVGSALAQSCTVTVGSVMALTGPLGALGEQIANGAKLAVNDINKAGGVNGCTLKLTLFDDQTRPSVGVDAAKKLVDIQHVPAIVGALSSGVSMAVLTSVTAPAKVVLISPASTSPTFTELAKEGKTGGYWFRDVPSDALQGVAIAQVAKNAGFSRVAVVYLNNPYGIGLANKFQAAFTHMGGTVTSMVVYNPTRPSYRSEVSKALQNNPGALFLIGYPGDATTVAREWIAASGPRQFLFPDGLESQKFINDVGAQYLNVVWGTAPGSVTTPSLATFRSEYKAMYGNFPTQAYMTNAYDAVVVVALAMESGHGSTAQIIKDNIRKVTGGGGETIYAGVKEFAKAAQLLKEGKKINYVGTVGSLNFDQYGDVAAPMVVWTVKGGQVAQTGMISVNAIEKLIQQMKK